MSKSSNLVVQRLLGCVQTSIDSLVYSYFGRFMYSINGEAYQILDRASPLHYHAFHSCDNTKNKDSGKSCLVIPDPCQIVINAYTRRNDELSVCLTTEKR